MTWIKTEILKNIVNTWVSAMAIKTCQYEDLSYIKSGGMRENDSDIFS